MRNLIGRLGVNIFIFLKRGRRILKINSYFITHVSWMQIVAGCRMQDVECGGRMQQAKYMNIANIFIKN